MSGAPDEQHAVWQAIVREAYAMTHQWAAHPFDAERLTVELAELRQAGERPSVDEARAMLEAMFPDDARYRQAVLERWRKLMRNPAHRFRGLRDTPRRPFYTQHRLEHQLGLRPTVAERIADEARRRLDDLLALIDSGPIEDYERARRLVDDALKQVERCRTSILGERATSLRLSPYQPFDWEHGPIDSVRAGWADGPPP